MSPEPFDLSRAFLRDPDHFERFRVPAAGEPLSGAGLDADELVLIVERGDAARAFLLRQIAYHHVAQGTLGGEPFVLSF